jgi:hypothetical protein
MADDLMRYDLLVQEALRRVVRMSLARVERSGLPGGHHFFITIDTRHPGVRMSDRLRKKYDPEITIVLQHQYWGLAVHERHFEVELSFDNIPEPLVIPFEAVKGFFDPAVQFGLQFADVTDDQRKEIADIGEPPLPETPAAETSPAGVRNSAPPDASGPEGVEPDEPPPGEKVVSLDKFRKK